MSCAYWAPKSTTRTGLWSGGTRVSVTVPGYRARTDPRAPLHVADLGTRRAGNGALGCTEHLEVLRELYRIVDFKTGRLEPAIATICSRIRRARSAVVAAMARLREHGFLDWIRRTEPVDNDGAGPQVKQVANAYWFGLPKAVAEWVTRKLDDGPAPDCELTRRDEDKRQVETMLQQTSAAEAVDFLVGNDDPQLAEILKRLGASIERNSASSPEGQNPASRD